MRNRMQAFRKIYRIGTFAMQFRYSRPKWKSGCWGAASCPPQAPRIQRELLAASDRFAAGAFCTARVPKWQGRGRDSAAWTRSRCRVEREPGHKWLPRQRERLLVRADGLRCLRRQVRMWPKLSFVAEGFNRIQQGRFSGGIETEEDAYQR